MYLGGAGALTTLYMDDLVIDCDGDDDYRVAPLGVGSIGARSPGLFDVAVYHDAEELPGYDKCFWSVALRLKISPRAAARSARIAG